MDKETAIRTINKLGKTASPFFFMIDYEMKESIVLPLNETLSNGVFIRFNEYQNFDTILKSAKPIEFKQNPVSFDQYLQAYNTIQSHLAMGNSYLVNLTFPTPICCNYSLFELFNGVNAKYKLLLNNRILVFSPETFVQINNGVISTFPMKGTIDANIPNAETIILENKKEQAEHATIVDLLRNDLSRVANNVLVEKFRYIETIETNNKKLLQVSTKIRGNLPPNYTSNLGTILFNMLPAGSVTGAPKQATLKIISNTESYKRGFYTGIAGIFDGKNLDSCVLIRFIENETGNLIYKSGGGITTMSNAKDEYQELIDKVYVPIS